MMISKKLSRSASAFTAAILAVISLCGCAHASLSARSAYVLIGRVAPGDSLEDAAKFLGAHTSERANGGDIVRTWGSDADEWKFDVLHDGKSVRATRITWRAENRRDRLTIFGQLTTEGRRYFGHAAKFPDFDTAEWSELDGRLLVRAAVRHDAGIVSLLAGMRGGSRATDASGF